VKTIKKFSQFNEAVVTPKVILYHRVSGIKHGLSGVELIRSVVENGLMPYDNGEIGSAIWFSSSFDDYANGGSLVVSIEYNEANKEEFDLYYSGRNGFAYKAIPFHALTVEKIPVCVTRGGYTTNADLINYINEGMAIPEDFGIQDTFYADIFNKYVQPYINVPDFLSKLDSSVTLINVM
jgi:hypothetical protein